MVTKGGGGLGGGGGGSSGFQEGGYGNTMRLY